ncbi:MAG: hypothetical protein WCD80_00625 [Desulfobaccales bacterium]
MEGAGQIFIIQVVAAPVVKQSFSRIKPQRILESKDFNPGKQLPGDLLPVSSMNREALVPTDRGFPATPPINCLISALLAWAGPQKNRIPPGFKTRWISWITP